MSITSAAPIIRTFPLGRQRNDGVVYHQASYIHIVYNRAHYVPYACIQQSHRWTAFDKVVHRLARSTPRASLANVFQVRYHELFPFHSMHGTLYMNSSVIIGILAFHSAGHTPDGYPFMGAISYSHAIFRPFKRHFANFGGTNPSMRIESPSGASISSAIVRNMCSAWSPFSSLATFAMHRYCHQLIQKHVRH